MSLDKALALVRLLKDSSLARLELEQQGLSIKIRRCPAIGTGTVIASRTAGRVRLAHPLRNRKPAPGRTIAAGEPICFIENDGLLLPVDSHTAGRIARLLVREGQQIECGAPLLVLRSA